MQNVGHVMLKTFKFVSTTQMMWYVDSNSICKMALHLCNLRHENHHSNQYFWFHMKQQVQQGL